MEAILCARAPAASHRHQVGLATLRKLQVGLTTLREPRQAGFAREPSCRFNNTTRDLFLACVEALGELSVAALLGVRLSALEPEA